jgi:hypothetical protein
MTTEPKPPYQEASWDDFCAAQLLWYVNRLIHLFGWAIVTDVDAAGKVTCVFPARTSFRGFSEEVETKDFIGLTQHLAAESQTLLKDVSDE